MKTTDDYRVPHNTEEGRRALSMKAGKGRVRYVTWRHFRKRYHTSNEFEIHVSPDNELHLEVMSGLPRLKVMPGSHITVVFRSTWGNSLEIMPGGSAHVIVPDPDTKVTISGDESKLTMSVAKNAEGKDRTYYPSKYPPLDL